MSHLSGRQQFLLNFVQLIVDQTHWRKHRLAVGIEILSNHHITAAEVFKVIGKGQSVRRMAPDSNLSCIQYSRFLPCVDAAGR